MSEFGYDEIVRELRGVRIEAPQRLRERVRELARQEPQPRLIDRVRAVPVRRTLLVLAPVALAGVVAAAVVHGVTSSGPRSVKAAPAPVLRSVLEPSRPHEQHGTALTDKAGAQGFAPAVPAPARLTDYNASIQIRVSDHDALTHATADAMRIARLLGGYVFSVDYTTPAGRPGNAYIQLRVPVGRVDDAMIRLSQLGTVLNQEVSMQDLQHVLERENERLASLRRTIRRLELALQDPSLPAHERVLLQIRLDDAKAALHRATRARRGTIRQGSTAKVALQLTTQKPLAPTKGSHSGRFGRAVHSSLSFLAGAGAVALAALIVLSPFALLAAFAVAGVRFRRRREEQRLLEA
jgi:hypothetical protein